MFIKINGIQFGIDLLPDEKIEIVPNENIRGSKLKLILGDKTYQQRTAEAGGINEYSISKRFCSR